MALTYFHVSPFHSLPLQFLAGWGAAEPALSLVRGLLTPSPPWAAPQHSREQLGLQSDLDHVLTAKPCMHSWTSGI